MNISGNEGELLVGGALDYTTCSKETSIVASSMDGTDGNGSGGGWRIGASTVGGCDGRVGDDGWHAGATTKDAWNVKDGRGESR
jgi:hypothetical protein